MTAHIEGSEDGNFYRGNKGCSGDGYSIYRSTDGGFTWTEHVLPTSETGTADTWNAEEAQVGTDEAAGVHAFWMGADDMPYYAFSTDEGDSWSDAIMIAPPIEGLTGTGFPVVTAGADGRVAFGYVGRVVNESGVARWNAYITVATDVRAAHPLFTTVQLNTDADPIDVTDDCGYVRCGGLGDFLDMRIDQHGRIWFALSHNAGGDIGIFGTMTAGPALRGAVGPLTTMPAGGPSTL